MFEPTAHKKTLSVFSLVMMNIIAVNSLRNLPIFAEYGFSLVFYSLLATFAFFIPVALVSAELATGWPRMGGIYVWVREAFGPRIGFLAIWLQWVYNIVWYPTILTFISTALFYFINPDLAKNQYIVLATVLSLFWIITLINSLGMRVSSSIATICAIIGTIIPMVFITFLGIIWLLRGNPLQISFTFEKFLPDLSSINNLVLFAAVMFGFMGVELSSVHADSVENPRRDYPRALLYSAILIFVMLVFSALSIAMVVPHKDLNMVTGFLDAYSILLHVNNLSWMAPIMAICIIIGAIGGVSAWALGPAKGLFVALSDIESFNFLKKVNKQGTPIGILIAQGIIFSILCSVFLLMPTISSSYWILSALSAQFALVVYILLFAAAIRLRYSQPHITRTFKLGKSNTLLWMLCSSGIITCVLTIFVGFFPPSQIEVGSIFKYELIMILGCIICVLPLFFIGPSREGSPVFVNIDK